MHWIKRGLRFECQPDCGKCCSNLREGSVFLEPSDIEALSQRVGVTTRQFAARYTRQEESSDIELAKTGAGDCVFLIDRTCTVHEAKPLQCRTYPFLPLDGFTPIESPYTWRYEKQFCPGIGKGRLFPKRLIAAISRGRARVDGFEPEPPLPLRSVRTRRKK